MVALANATDDPASGARQIDVTLTDGDGGTSNTVSGWVTMTLINDEPVNVVPGAQSTANGHRPRLLDERRQRHLHLRCGFGRRRRRDDALGVERHPLAQHARRDRGRERPPTRSTRAARPSPSSPWRPTAATSSPGSPRTAIRTGSTRGATTAAGNPIGAEFLVAQTTSGNQSRPDITMDASGNFAISWIRHAGRHGRRLRAAFRRQRNAEHGRVPRQQCDRRQPDETRESRWTTSETLASSGGTARTADVSGRLFDAGGSALAGQFEPQHDDGGLPGPARHRHDADGRVRDDLDL